MRAVRRLRRAAAGALAAAILLPAAGAVAGPDAGAINVTVSNVRDDAGHVRIDVCTEQSFLKNGCPYSGGALAEQGVTTVRIEGVPPGVYALQVYHDRNDNHRVDRTRHFGIPLEEIGFSNDAPVGLRGPKWAKAAFVHGYDSQTLTVDLRRYN